MGLARKPLASPVALLALSMVALIGLALAIPVKLDAGAHPPASSAPASDDIGFPSVDWEFWQAENPDIVGWITIPGTPVNNPVAQASPEDPDFYLYHDAYAEPNFTGCPYLDPECCVQDLGSACCNIVITGHNMGWNEEVFGSLPHYLERDWGDARRRVLFQTPTSKTELEVYASSVIPGLQAHKRTRFESASALAAWQQEELGQADLVYEKPKQTGGLMTLATCSYIHWAENERTLVFAQVCESWPAQ